MKKIILTLAFIFTVTLNFVSATEVVSEVSLEEFTFDECDGYAAVYGHIYGLTYEQEHDKFVECMGWA